MSCVLRRKHVLKEMMEDNYELPTEQQQIVRVVSSRGNNLHEVEAATGDTENFLVSMPNKFRRNIYVKRGSYVLVEPIDEGDKVKAEICKILTAEHIKEYTKAGVWPNKFGKKREHTEVSGNEEDEDDEFLMGNPNRPAMELEDCESDTDSDDDSTNEED